MTVVESFANLSEDFSGVSFREIFYLDDAIEQFSTSAQPKLKAVQRYQVNLFNLSKLEILKSRNRNKLTLSQDIRLSHLQNIRRA